MSLHLIKSDSLFLHIPKTGGTWVEEALKASGVEAEYAKAISNVTWRHSLVSQYTQAYDFVFTFVRHPISWYESWWKFQTSLSWIEHEPGVWHPQRVLGKCASNNFAEFTLSCIEQEPAYVSRMYEWYIGPQDVNSSISSDTMSGLQTILPECSDYFRRNSMRKY